MLTSMDLPEITRIRSQVTLVLLLAGLISCDPSRTARVTMDTELGEITIEVDTIHAPVTGKNFLDLVEKGAFRDASFYRVVRLDNQPGNNVKIEVIQGGLFRDNRIEAFTPIPHETTESTGILHQDGVISMARNEPGSASTEFFICIGDQPSLDYGGDRNPDGQGFAAFGRVIRGMEVVKKIQILPDTGQFLVDQVAIREMQVLK